MKMFAVVLLSVLTIPAHAQRLLESLETYQKEIAPPKPAAGDNSGKPEVKVDPVAKTKTSGQCTEADQTSIPLAYITSLIQQKDGKLDVIHNRAAGTLEIKSPEMISNCSNMIEWVPNARSVDGRKIYSIEARIKKDSDCSEDGCTYDVAMVEKKQFKKWERIKFKPTMQGFEECLEKSGVLKAGKVVTDAIYPDTIGEKFDGFKESGELLFVSHGPASKLVKAKYDKFVEVDKCDHYEKILPEGSFLTSLDEAERERILAEKAKIRDCGEYEKISDFIAKYEGYSEDLNAIRDQLILDAVKKAAKAIAEGKQTNEDLKVLADFHRLIVKPKTDLASLLYQEAAVLDADEQKAKLEQMKAVLTELASYNQAPYLSQAIVQKLEDQGLFDDASRANATKALIVSHMRLGQKENGVLITPSVANERASALVKAYDEELVDVKEKYEIRTGQSSGCSALQTQQSCSASYGQLSSRMQQNIQIRSHNFTQEIQSEYARVQQPNGYCYRSPFRNVQRCIQRSLERVQDLQAQMQHFNKVDAERAVEYQQKAQEYAKLEKEGRDYVARQNGEQPAAEAPTDNTRPQARVEEGYSFNFEGQGQVQQQGNQQYNPYQQQQQYQQQTMNPYMQQNGNMFQQQYNPYQQQAQQYGPYQQQPGNQWYGQFSFNAGNQYGNYNQQQYNPYMQGQQYYQQPGQQQYNPYMQSMFNQQSNPYGQQGYQQQQGYFSNPYQAYNQYNMYRN